MKGFSLVEIIIVMAILAVIGGLVFNFYTGYKSQVEIDTEVNVIILKLKEARGYALNGEQFAKWGVHFDNPTAGPDASRPFYELFYGVSYPGTIKEKIYLSSFLQFNTPASSTACDIIFAINTGKKDVSTTCANVVIALKSGANTKTITVNAEGKIE